MTHKQDKMNLTKEQKKILARKIWKILKWGIFLSLIYLAYTMGTMRGLIAGVTIVQEKHNETVCDFINKERDSDGFCLLNNGTFKYRYYLDCGWEKFKINGEKKPPFLLKASEEIRRWIFYPAMGC